MGWLPEGYELVRSRTTDATILHYYVKATDTAEQRIEVQILKFDGAGIFKVDTEADQVYQVSVQNTLATVIERNGCVQITWMYPKSNYIVMLCSDSISTETALRIAQSIVLP